MRDFEVSYAQFYTFKARQLDSHATSSKSHDGNFALISQR